MGEHIFCDIRFLRFENNELIHNSQLFIHSKEKTALIGRNGSGKSTLIRLILNFYEKGEIPGAIEFSGKIFISPDVKIAYLPQEIKFQFPGTVEEYLDFCGGELIRIFKRYKELSEKETLSQEEIQEYSQIIEQMIQFDLWDYENRRERILKRLGIDSEILKRNLQEISGGEATKIALAGVLLSDSNFWILDEPTNNLDKDSINLLFEEMRRFNGGILCITHDRRLLNISSKIYEIDEETKNLRVWGGNYEFYKKKKEEEFLGRMRRYEEQERTKERLEKAIEELKKRAERFEKISKDAFYRRKGAKIARRAKVQEERILRELSQLTEPKPPERPEFPKPLPEVLKGTILSIKDLHYFFNNKELIYIHHLILEAGERLLIEGPNGSGKTTLIKIILGEIRSQQGEIRLRENIKIGYLPQSPNIKNINQKTYQFLKDEYNLTEGEIKAILNRMKISDVFNLKLKDLSIGEIRRLQLAAILFKNPDILILDEPTNHLDLYTVEELEAALKDYQGTIIFVSHDEYFINNLKPTKKIVLTKGGFN